MSSVILQVAILDKNASEDTLKDASVSYPRTWDSKFQLLKVLRVCFRYYFETKCVRSSNLQWRRGKEHTAGRGMVQLNEQHLKLSTSYRTRGGSIPGTYADPKSWVEQKYSDSDLDKFNGPSGIRIAEYCRG